MYQSLMATLVPVGNPLSFTTVSVVVAPEVMEMIRAENSGSSPSKTSPTMTP